MIIGYILGLQLELNLLRWGIGDFRGDYSRGY